MSERTHSGSLAADGDREPVLAAEQNQVRPLRILLAEDSLPNQKLAAGLLTKWGHTLTVTGNGREAIAAWEAQPFDLILMDVQMPELDGLQAAMLIRESERVSDEETVWLSKDIAKRIENELEYPGQIKVTVIRETRAVEYAR